jgi:type 1 glutamine amidotransferase
MKTLRHIWFPLLLLLAVFTAPAQAARLVIMIGEDEYRTWETLPEFAKNDITPHGHHVTIIQADEADKNHFPGLIEALRNADLLLVSVRRRTPRREQLDSIRAHVAAGKPVIGIRTASHAFALTPKAVISDPSLGVWPEFDAQVLGGHYTGHYGRDAATIAVTPGRESHPILSGIAVKKLIGHGGLYKNTPLEKTATLLLTGTIPGQITEPVAWTHHHGAKPGRVFYTSLGHADDFKVPDFRRLLLNAIAWALHP